MIKRFTSGIDKYLHQETLAERIKRMQAGAIYSALTVIIYLIVSSTINVLIFRNLNLAVDWTRLLLSCLEFGLILAVAGVIVAWFTETHEGIVYGGIVLALLILVGNLAATAVIGQSFHLLSQSIIIVILPLIGAGILFAGAIRMAVNRHVKISQLENPQIRRKQSVQLIGLICLVGVVIGAFSLFGTTSLNSVRALNSVLQNYATDPLVENRFPYQELPGLKNHLGMSYTLVAGTAYTSADAMEVTIRFKDGYSVACVVPLLGANEQLLMNTCNEGAALKSP